MTHARCSASAAERWIACPGSINLAEGLPNKSSIHAATGTYAHTIAAYYLRERGRASWPLNKEEVVDGHKVVCNSEMVDGIQLYLDTLIGAEQQGDITDIEVDLTPALAKLDPDLGGTADYTRWRPSVKQLRVFDFKYGAGLLVSPVENMQLKIYALGALLTLNQPAEEVVVTIVQPRIEHENGRVRDWAFPARDLLEFAGDIAHAAALTRDPNAPLVPGPVQCQFCPAARICPALEKAQHALVAQDFELVEGKYDPVALSKALSDFPLIEARMKAMRQFAYEEAERGNPPPGWKLVAKRGTRKWTDPEAVVKLAKELKVKPYEEPELKSPAQMEKGLPKVAKEKLAELVVSVSSGHTLVPESDKRPAVHAALIGEFSVIETVE